MSDLDVDSDIKDRHTGAAAEFLIRGARAAHEKVIAANQQRTDAVTAANARAQAVLAEAHRTAADTLGQNLKNCYALTDSAATVLDVGGAVVATVPSHGAANVALDAGAGRLYWGQVGSSSSPTALPPAPPSRPETLRQGEVALYEDDNYQGRVWLFNVALRDFRPFPGLNDQVSSVRVGPATTATLFEHVNFGGRGQSFSSDTPVLQGSVIGNDVASSLRIQVGDGSLRPGEVALFSDANFSGQRWVFSAAQSDFRSVPALNDTVSSLRLGPNTAVTLFADVNFQGASQEFTRDVAWLGGTAVGNDTASSLRTRVGTLLPRAGEVVLYEHMDFQGRCWIFNAEVSDLRNFEGLNDQVSSLRVGPNTAVTLYEDVAFQGWSQTFQQDTRWLADTTLGNDVASSFRLSGSTGAGPVAPGHVALYEHYDFQGRVWQFNADVPDFRVFEGLDDRVSSVWVGADTTATLYEHAGMAGRSQKLMQDSPNLSVTAVGNDTASSLTVRPGAPELHVVSAALDGTQPAVVARAPAGPATVAGSVALDTGARFVFWALPTGAVVRSGMDGEGMTTVVQPGDGPGTGLRAIALDAAHKQVYWSRSGTIGAAGYDGSSPRTVASSPWGASPVAVFAASPAPPREAAPAPPALAVDPATSALYWNDGTALFRSGLDGSKPSAIHRPSLRILGLALDVATQLLYWVEGGSLMRATVEATLTPEAVFALPVSERPVLGIAILTLSGTATQRLQDAHAGRQQAQESGAQSVDQAHRNATARRQDAQTNLQNAHTQATQSIAAKRQDAAARRQTALDGLQQTHTTAAQKVTDAKASADARRQQASIDAANIKAEAQRQADAIKKPAQDKLDEARRKQQSS